MKTIDCSNKPSFYDQKQVISFKEEAGCGKYAGSYQTEGKEAGCGSFTIGRLPPRGFICCYPIPRVNRKI
jgi:hypothetical protein